LNAWYLTFILILVGFGLFGFVVLLEGPNSFLLVGTVLEHALIGVMALIIAVSSLVYFFVTRKHWNTD